MKLQSFEGQIEGLYPADGGHMRTAQVRVLSINGEPLPQDGQSVNVALQPNDNFQTGDHVFGKVVVNNGEVQQISEMTTKAPDLTKPTTTLEKVYGRIADTTSNPCGLSILKVDVITMDEQPTPNTRLQFAVAAKHTPKGAYFEAKIQFDQEGKVVQVVDFKIVPSPVFSAIGDCVPVPDSDDFRIVAVVAHFIGDTHEIYQPCDLVIPAEFAHRFNVLRSRTRIADPGELGTVSGTIVGVAKISELHSNRKVEGHCLLTVAADTICGHEVKRKNQFCFIIPTATDFKRGSRITLKTECEPTKAECKHKRV